MYVGGLENAVDLSLSLLSCGTQTMPSPNCAVLLNKWPGVVCVAPRLHHGFGVIVIDMLCSTRSLWFVKSLVSTGSKLCLRGASYIMAV